MGEFNKNNHILQEKIDLNILNFRKIVTILFKTIRNNVKIDEITSNFNLYETINKKLKVITEEMELLIYECDNLINLINSSKNKYDKEIENTIELLENNLLKIKRKHIYYYGNVKNNQISGMCCKKCFKPLKIVKKEVSFNHFIMSENTMFNQYVS